MKYCRHAPGHLIFIMQVFRHLRLLILCAVIPTGKQPFFRGYTAEGGFWKTGPILSIFVLFRCLRVDALGVCKLTFVTCDNTYMCMRMYSAHDLESDVVPVCRATGGELWSSLRLRVSCCLHRFRLGGEILLCFVLVVFLILCRDL